MAYFLPSFFQKRLLRYALSRLELVDTEALDLDSLGIRWGQRSTVELRDVGLKLEVSGNVPFCCIGRWVTGVITTLFPFSHPVYCDLSFGKLDVFLIYLYLYLETVHSSSPSCVNRVAQRPGPVPPNHRSGRYLQ